MYNVDINFLKNRPEYQNISAPVDRAGSTTKVTNYSKTPIFVGLGVGLAALLGTGAFGWLSIRQGEALQAKQVELDKKLGEAKVQEAKLTALQTQISVAEQETQSLAGAFNLVRPWSAVMKEFKESTPQGVQISAIIQSVGAPSPTPAKPVSGVPGAAATKLASTPATVDSSGQSSKGTPSPSASPVASTTPAASPTASPVASASPSASPAPAAIDAPITKIEVEGVAQSFNDVNSFILTLKQSAFFNPEDTQLISSELKTDTVSLSNTGATGSTATTITTKSVKYKIQTSLKQIPATELLRELERKGAIGLVTRLKTLQQQKVIKP
jgi:type IV pilus assembly protein PilN